MSRWLPDLLRRPTHTQVVAGLDAQGMAWQCGNEPPSSAGQATEVSEFARQLVPKARVAVIVTEDVAVHWVQTPPTGVQSLKELRQIAAARCAHLFGGSPAGWWVAGDWRATRGFVCAGLPLERVGPLRRVLTEAGAQTSWHTTWGLLCSAQAGDFPADGWSAVRSAGRVVVWCCQRGQVVALDALNLGEQADATEANDAVARHLRIEAMRDPTLGVGPVHWTDLPAPANALPYMGASGALALAPWLQGALR
ncbi:hypothetical protein [Hydrogenophaga sp.]|uniref:hypothetical protein n=1 Tax=Hydrogenophaga sp. TaxID=1904254 RepID=UPI002719CC1D|nr:hypothetical protein [Hydrogenophaga sp.]MDO9135989.1 hypothetical protein [Hydrogenophaga sp.]